VKNNSNKLNKETLLGEYQICLSSAINYGTIRLDLELYAYHLAQLQAAIKDRVETNSLQQDIEVFEYGIIGTTELQKRMEKLFANTYQVFHGLKYRGILILKDTNLQEKNKQYIDRFSLFQAIVVVAAASVQILLIRRFFRVDPKRIHF
jgi:hypothetical protein